MVRGVFDTEAAKGRIYSMNREVIPKLVGSWKLVSFHSQDSSGQTAYPFGKDAHGRLIYEPDGRMAVQLMNPNRPGFTSDDPLVTSEDEVRAAFGGYTAYYGTYSVNPDEQTITHRIEAALLPNWVGTDQLRHFEFDGKYLTLKGLCASAASRGLSAWSGNACAEAQTAMQRHCLHQQEEIGVPKESWRWRFCFWCLLS